MKTLAFFSALIFVCHAQSGLQSVGGGDYAPGIPIPNTPPTKYPLKNVPFDSAKFKEIFDLVAAARVREQGSERFVEIIQTVSPGKFLAHLDRRQKVVMVSIPGKEYADQASLSVKLESTGVPFEYTTPLGAKATVESYQIIAEDREFTPIEFREKLMMGQTFVVSKIMPESVCKTCNGFGRIPDRQGSRSGDGKIKCEACGGDGKVRLTANIEITW